MCKTIITSHIAGSVQTPGVQLMEEDDRFSFLSSSRSMFRAHIRALFAWQRLRLPPRGRHTTLAYFHVGLSMQAPTKCDHGIFNYFALAKTFWRNCNDTFSATLDARLKGDLKNLCQKLCTDIRGPQRMNQEDLSRQLLDGWPWKLATIKLCLFIM